ncbi:MAG TPA: hypothetical protein VNO33_00955 [Kofleriaceae bacterium]|nr:hypothetical protein [Kofleriaceae bacterium]
MKTTCLALAILSLTLAIPSVATAETAGATAELSRGFGVRALVVQPGAELPLQVGMAVDFRLRRGNLAPHMGLSFATSPSGAGGHIRAEGTFNYFIGPLYIGAGGAAGTLSIETPEAISGKWTGAALALHAQIGTLIGLGGGGRGLCLELRGGHTLPLGSVNPLEQTPESAARLELAGSIGVIF